MAKTIKLTPQILRQIVLEEKRKLQLEAAAKSSSDIGEDKPTEVDADEYADTLESKKDHAPKMENFRRKYQQLVAEERALQDRLKKISESKKAVRARLLRNK